MKKISSHIKRLFVALACFFLSFTFSVAAAPASSTTNEVSSIEEYTLRPSTAGSLHVDGTSLYGKDNQEVILQGASLHGLTWYSQYVNEDLFDYVSQDWQTNFIRLPMYSQVYAKGKQSESLQLVEKGVEYATKSDMYVLIDWHILEDNNPNTYLSYAIDFFKTVSAKYADYTNVLYEICNEPNGATTWKDIQDYANIIIPIIRQNDPDSLILVGTPNFDRDLVSPTNNPLNYQNIMYTFHFYAASHKQEMRNTLTTALDHKLPVFISECGLSEDSGDGTLDYDEAKTWFTLLHQRHLSHAIWSLSNKEESSAMIKYSSSTIGKLTDADLSTCGKWVRALYRGESLDAIATNENSGVSFYDILRTNKLWEWLFFAGVTLAFLLLVALITVLFIKLSHKKKKSYDELLKVTGGTPGEQESLSKEDRKKQKMIAFGKVSLLLMTFFTFIYLLWRILFSIPTVYGWLAITCNIILLLVEMLGFAESLVHYYAMLHLRKHPLPKISKEEYPDVDLFISTYNEPTDLLRKTIIGCKHIEYPDKNKVHIYLCDDHRRPEMKALAEELKINYFDRPDNQGAKAGNLNHALGLTSSPYIVTFDADMIPRREFLMKTIPYFVDAEKRNASLPEKDRMPLGFVQTPQCFYNPDVFQHDLYNEKHIPNEQDFFYRTIESAKTYSNSVIYGGSNTIISRKALEDIGGFFTETITEDFATGMLIESHGYVSLGLSEPLASGLAPTSFKEHVKQRIRWGRGVILTGRKLKFLFNPKLTIEQKASYWGSVVYWYSPLKNMIYLLSPLMYALFTIPVFKCTWLDITIFWLPMFIFQNITLRVISTKTMSSKWSGIQETSVMPFLFLPILKETFGISLSTFKVTNKNGGVEERKVDFKMLLPFLVLILMSLAAIVIRTIGLFVDRDFGLIVILFWLIRNLYFLLMSMFLVIGRSRDGENIHVYAKELIMADGNHMGATTHLTEHGLTATFKEAELYRIGDSAEIQIKTPTYELTVKGVVIGIKKSRKNPVLDKYCFEITDFHQNKDEYVQMIHDRIPTLPQEFHKELGLLPDLWRNIARRLSSNKD